MSLKDYVIGGMDRDFKRKLYDALHAMEDAGFSPGITSAFRDDYRQGLARGNKAAADSSYHGGSRRGGYGHGVAADLVSVKGETCRRCTWAKFCGSGRCAKEPGSGDRTPTRIHRMLRRSMAKNMPINEARRRHDSPERDGDRCHKHKVTNGFWHSVRQVSTMSALPSKEDIQQLD
jgi:hypothetical protein